MPDRTNYSTLTPEQSTRIFLGAGLHLAKLVADIEDAHKVLDEMGAPTHHGDVQLSVGGRLRGLLKVQEKRDAR